MTFEWALENLVVHLYLLRGFLAMRLLVDFIKSAYGIDIIVTPGVSSIWGIEEAIVKAC
jgi:hypothetical protein